MSDEERLRLYHEVASTLNRFFSRWISCFCQRCLEVSEKAHPADPRMDVELVGGVFPGCCQTGVDLVSVRGLGEGDSPEAFSEAFKELFDAERAKRKSRGETGYAMKEIASGRIVEGKGCPHLGPGGCLLEEWKAPLCLGYLCEGAAAAVEAATGQSGLAADVDNFLGTMDILRVVAGDDREAAAREIARLGRLVARLEELLQKWEERSGEDLCEAWLSGRLNKEVY